MMITGDWVSPHLPYPPQTASPPKDLHLKGAFPISLISAFPFSRDGEKLWQQFQIPYRIEMMINMGANSILSLGNARQVEEHLKKIPFIVSFDLFLNESTDFADIVLPDTSFLERLDFGPNRHFIFNHPAGMGEWCWPLRQPAVETNHQRRYFGEVILDLAYRVGVGEQANMVLNMHFGLKERYWLAPDKTYTYEEITDHVLKSYFGEQKGLDWFKEHGLIKWPKKPKEVYWKPFHQVRIPIYFEYIKRTGEQVRKISEQFSAGLDCSHYEALPEWHPCPSHLVKDKEYDLWSFYYRDVLHTNSFTMENPLLDEASQMTPYTYTISINPEAACKNGIKQGDLIWVESSYGRKVKGQANLTEGMMPEAVGIAACAGHWSVDQPVARGKGVFYNDLIEIDYEHMDPTNLSMDLCAKVKIYKA